MSTSEERPDRPAGDGMHPQEGLTPPPDAGVWANPSSQPPQQQGYPPLQGYPPQPGQTASQGYVGHAAPSHGYGAWQPNRIRSVTGLGITVLAMSGIVTLLQIGVAATSFEYAAYYADLPPGVPLDQTPILAYDTFTLLWGLSLLAAWIVTSTWLYTVRTNVDQIDRAGQRRGKVWAWLGWLVPIVSLWFPYQVMKDAARTSTARPLPVGWWWATWLFAVVSLNATGQFTGNGFALPDPDLVQALPAFEVLAVVGYVAALALLVPIVLTMNAAQPSLAQRLPQQPSPQPMYATPAGPPPPGPMA